jgi:hypothetical protein
MSIVSVPIEAKRTRLHSQGRKERMMAREATLRSGHHLVTVLPEAASIDYIIYVKYYYTVCQSASLT